MSLQNHYATSATDYCDRSQTFNCDLVNRSTYSAVHGVPVALVGFLGYLLLFVLSWRTTGRIASVRFVASLIGLAFALYLAYIEAYVLAVWCLLCIGSMTAIFDHTVDGRCPLAIWSYGTERMTEDNVASRLFASVSGPRDSRPGEETLGNQERHRPFRDQRRPLDAVHY